MYSRVSAHRDQLQKTFRHLINRELQGDRIRDISQVELKAQIRFITNNKLHCILDFLRTLTTS